MRPLKKMIVISLLASILSISAYLSIPLSLSNVSFTLQSLIIMIIALSMPISISFYTLSLYLLLGLIGLPVFANGTAGLPVLFGPTGGYLLGFLIATPVIGLIKEKLEYLFGYLFASFLGGIIIVYSCGVFGLMFVLNISLKQALVIGVYPFLIFDLIKVFIASVFVYNSRSIFKRILKK